jgi:hypothetical protein
MKIRNLMILLILCMFLISITTFSNQITAIYGIDDGMDHIPTAIVACNDGGFLIGGITFPPEGPYFARPLLIIRVDSSGNIIWQRAMGDDTNNCGITKTSDGCYLVSSWLYSASSMYYVSGWLIKIDDNGNTLWQRAYGERTFLMRTYELSDHSLISVGGCYCEDQSSGWKQCGLVMKIDAQGNPIWKKQVSVKGIDDMSFLGVTVINDDQFLVWGKDRIYQFKTDGTILKSMKIDEEYTSIKSIILTPSNEYLVATHYPSDDFYYSGYSQILTLDRAFNLKWAKKIVTYKKNPTDYGNTWIAPLIIKSDGTIVAGVRYAGYYTPDANIAQRWEGYFEFSNGGTPNDVGKVFSLPNYESIYTSSSFTCSKEDNITYITALCVAENYCSFCTRMKFALIRTDNNNNITGSCATSSETPLVWEELQDISFSEVEDGVTDLDLNSIDTTPLNLIDIGNAKWINTFCPVIYQVNKLQNPFRLEILGEGFTTMEEHLNVYINGTSVPITTWKSTQRIIAKKGDALKNMLPKGVPVCIQVKVVDYQGNLVNNYQSDCFYFAR